jgi:hypothetical protein
MSRDYFYFISGLPNLNFEDSKLAYSPEQFRTEAAAQLSESDFRFLEILHLPQDLENLLRLVYKSEKDFNLKVFTRIRTGKLIWNSSEGSWTNLIWPAPRSFPSCRNLLAIPSLEFSNRRICNPC